MKINGNGGSVLRQERLKMNDYGSSRFGFHKPFPFFGLPAPRSESLHREFAMGSQMLAGS